MLLSPSVAAPQGAAAWLHHPGKVYLQRQVGQGSGTSLCWAGQGERSLLSNAGMQVGLNAAEAGLIWCPTKPPFFPSRCILYSGCLLLSRASLILPLSPPFPFRPLANGKGMSSSLQEGN